MEIGGYFNITGWNANLDLTNCNGGNINVKFDSQEVCDRLFQSLLDNGLGDTGGGTLYITNNNFIPSQAIQDAFTAKGVTINIS